MGLQDYSYRLKPLTGDTAAHDELAVSGDLAGTGTLSLVDRGAGDVAWQVSTGVVSVTVPAKTPNRAAAADGVTLALRLRIVNYGATDFQFFVGVGVAGATNGIRLGRTSSGNLRSRYALNATTTAYAQAAGADFIVVMRAATAGAAAEVMSLFRSGTTDTNAQTTVDQAMNTFFIDATGTPIIQVADAVWWREELSDTDCQALITNGIRATLDPTPTNTTLTAEKGDYTFTGQDANLVFNRVLSADTGSYSITGFDTGTVNTYTLVADTGTYNIVGTDALRDFTMFANHGVYNFSGNDATLTKTTVGSYVLTAESGVYTITGQDALFNKTNVYNIVAESGVYDLTGRNAQLRWSGAPIVYATECQMSISIKLGL